MHKFDLTKFDENCLKQHQMKMLVGFGTLLGFRGNNEHTNMLLSQIGTGRFPNDHPLFPGYEWAGLKHFYRDKSQELSIENPTVRVLGKDIGKFPILPGHPKDFGGSILRYIAKNPKGTNCQRFYRRVASDGKSFNPERPLGKHAITERMREAFQLLGISNWDKLCPHALRSFFSTMMNLKGVPVSEIKDAMRHKTVDQTVNYMALTKNAACSRMAALLDIPANVAIRPGKRNSAGDYSSSEDDSFLKNLTFKNRKPNKKLRKKIIEALGDDSSDDVPKKKYSNKFPEVIEIESDMKPHAHPDTSPTIEETKMSEFTQAQFNGLEEDLREATTKSNSHSSFPSNFIDIDRFENDNCHTSSGDFSCGYSDVYSPSQYIADMRKKQAAEENLKRGTLHNYFPSRREQPSQGWSQHVNPPAQSRLPSEREFGILSMRMNIARENERLSQQEYDRRRREEYDRRRREEYDRHRREEYDRRRQEEDRSSRIYIFPKNERHNKSWWH